MTVTVEAEVELSDICNREFVDELAYRIKHKKFTDAEVNQLMEAVQGVTPVAITDEMILSAVREAKNKLPYYEILNRLAC
jgi:hypothetical protein